MRYSKLTNIAPEIGPSKRGGILATMCIHQSRQNRVGRFSSPGVRHG